MRITISSSNHNGSSLRLSLLVLHILEITIIILQCYYLRPSAADIPLVHLPPGKVVPAVFGFGDSIIDPGNNNNLESPLSQLVKSNYPPYGQDFMGGKPTGRFSNGKIPTDIVEQALGIKEIMPAYLDPNLKPEELLTGVCFASGGAGYDPLTSQLSGAIPLTSQLGLFKDYITKLTSMVGPNRTNFILTNSLFLVVIGSDDISNTYFGPPVRRLHYSYDSYTDFMLQEATSFVCQLHALGARRIGVFGAPPIGCVPSQRTLSGGLARNCATNQNDLAVLFNFKLEKELGVLEGRLGGGTKLVYVDIYYPLLDIIENPQKYGFEVVDRGCCGTGLIEVTRLCNKLSKVCNDVEKYLFWDSYHPSQRGYEILSEAVLNMAVRQFT